MTLCMLNPVFLLIWYFHRTEKKGKEKKSPKNNNISPQLLTRYFSSSKKNDKQDSLCCWWAIGWLNMTSGSVTIVTTHSESQNYLLTLGQLLLLKEIKTPSLHHACRLWQSFPCMSRRQNFISLGLKAPLTPDPRGAWNSHFSWEGLLTSGLESMKPPQPTARVSP